MALGNSKGLESQFSHKAAVTLAEFSMTQNCATQAVAKANADMANTGTGEMVIAGQPVLNIQDAALDISADRQLEAWVTATAYTATATRVDVRYVTDANGNKQWYKCILAHTSSAANKPGQKDSVNSTWRTYWTESSNRAEAARGQTCANLKTRHYLCLCDRLGVMTTVQADNGLQLDADSEIQIPQFDPSVFVAIALLTVDGTGASTWGTTDDSAQVTVRQLLGPVYPHEDKLDKN
jgi:3D (Asp-Asp-Asp) domain-containing protein